MVMLKDRISETYKNKQGTIFPHVKELRFNENELLKLGKFIVQTSHNLKFSNKSSFCDDLGDIGVLIYQDEDDKNIGYRLDLEYNNIYFDDQMCARKIEKLQELQPQIQKTQFPYGVVTREGRVIGEIMPFYPNCENIFEYLSNRDAINVLEIYKQVLGILTELMDNGVLYRDIHKKNFLINSSGIPVVHVIDFDTQYTEIGKFSQSDVKSMLFNLKRFLVELQSLVKEEEKIKLSNMTLEFENKVLKK